MLLLYYLNWNWTIGGSVKIVLGVHNIMILIKFEL